MLQLIGGIFIMLGCFGIGNRMVLDLRDERKTLIDFLQFLTLLQSEITYKKETIPDGCGKCGEKIGGKIGEHLVKIQEKVENGLPFSQAWGEEIKGYIAGKKLKKEVKEYLIAFPKQVGFSDGNMQVLAVEQYVSELHRIKQELEENLKEQSKVIRALSLCGGAILALILW